MDIRDEQYQKEVHGEINMFVETVTIEDGVMMGSEVFFYGKS